MHPVKKSLEVFFEDFFVLNKPKDIVSGDFYWMTKVGFKKVIVIADCTGHGVPGAMMSMLGNSLLRDIVDKRQITSPGKILSQLNTEIRKVLHQDNNENQDGMDMSIITIDCKKRIVTFAGAKHKLLYIQDGQTYIISGDRCGIGGDDKVQSECLTFSSYTLDISTTSIPIFYMFTDGFRDQFGGEENRKYSLSRLVSLLIKIHQRPCKEQHQILADSFKEWMVAGRELQTDDVLLLGFRPKQMTEIKSGQNVSLMSNQSTMNTFASILNKEEGSN